MQHIIKKRIAHILMILLAITVVTCFVPQTGMQANANETVTHYAIWVGNTEVTSENMDDVLNDGGKAKFYNSTDTLTLDDPTIKEMYSDEKLTSAIYSKDASFTLKGKASLINKGESGKANGIYVNNADLTIDGKFKIESRNYNICAQNVTITGGTINTKKVAGIIANNSVKINGGTLKCDGQTAIYAIGGITINDSDLEIIEPEGGSISGDKREIVDKDGKKAKKVTIAPKSGAAPDLYTVYFTDGQGNTLKTETVDEGTAATPPADPSRKGYIFDGWDKDFKKVTKDLTVTANWKTIIDNAKVVLSASELAFNGKIQKPVIRTIGGKKLKAGTDYTVKWSYKLTITGKGNYVGTTKASYKINPKGTSIKKLKKAKKAVKIKLKKQSAKMAKTRITGYQVWLATNKKFTKNKKSVNFNGYKKVSKKVAKLKGGKKYYVKVRTYMKVKGTKFYSKWSKVKTVKTKK